VETRPLSGERSRRPARRAAGHPSSLVNRAETLIDLAHAACGVPERELRLVVDGIREWLAGLARDGASSRFLGILEGEPGQGRRAILGAVREATRSMGIRVLRGRASRRAPFPPGALADIFSECAGDLLPGGEDSLPADIAAQVSLFLGTSGPTGLPRDLPDIASAELARSRMSDALARALCHLGMKGPLVIMIEDLDLADGLTLDVMRQVTRMLWLRRERRSQPRILIVATLPEGRDGGSELASFVVRPEDASLFRIRARGYSREDVRRLVQQVLGVDAPLSFRERLYRVTGGNVRHVRWIVGHVAERGAPPGSHVLDAEPLERLVRKRFAALSPEEQRIVLALSTLETRLSIRCLAALVAGDGSPDGPGEEDIARVLESLAGRGWIERADADAPGSEPAYSPGDPTIVDVLLEDLGERLRERCSSGLEGRLAPLLGAEPPGRRLAFAGFLCERASDIRSDALEPCAEYLEGIGCSREALDLAEMVLEGERGLDETARRRWSLRRAALLQALGMHAEAMESLRVLVPGASNAAEGARIHRAMGALRARLGDRDGEIEEYEQGFRLLEECAEPIEAVRLRISLAGAVLESGAPDPALARLEECLVRSGETTGLTEPDHADLQALLEAIRRRRVETAPSGAAERMAQDLSWRRGDAGDLVHLLEAMAQAHAGRGDPARAGECLEAAARLARETGSRWLQGIALLHLGRHHRALQDPATARTHLHEARGIFLDLGRADLGHAVSSAALSLEFEDARFPAAGRWARVLAAEWCDDGEGPPATTEDAASRRRRLQEVEAALGRQGAPPSKDLLVLGRLLEDDGRLAEAEKAYQECLRDEPGRAPQVRIQAIHSLGRITALRGEDDRALRLFEQALQLDEGGGLTREVLLESYLEVGAIFLERGGLGRAFDYSLRALRLALEGGGKHLAVRALLGFSDLLAEGGAFGASLDLAHASLLLARRAGLARWELVSSRHVGRAMAGEQSDGALDAFSRALEIAAVLDLPVETCRVKLDLAWERYRRREFPEALRLAREGLETARSLSLAKLIDELLHLVGVVESASTNPRKNFLRALEALEQALQGAEARSRPRLRWEVLHALARIYRERGKPEPAAEHETKAREVEAAVFSPAPRELRGLVWRSRAD
jgi:tetratricopeptide (TPR) repeat protein